ncbi:MAG TPA: hypothetical protein VMH83_13325 [Candidatus Acidoferrum sp.]|nr:hypothetical protein [Candidatus Acidoferrum sp.]
MSVGIPCEQARLWLAENKPQQLTTEQQQNLALHLQGCATCAEEAAAFGELQNLLAREQSPSPLARARFLAALQQQASMQQQPINAGIAGFLRALWPTRPAWSMGYSAALLVLGLVVGQLLPPRTFGVGPQMSEERLIHLCAVPPKPPEVL